MFDYQRPASHAEIAVGTSLWKDAWRRLLKNKLAVFGLIVVLLVTLASLLGPYVLKLTTGMTPDYIPGDGALDTDRFLRFTAPDGSFSWTHPMGTDRQGRDLLARVLQGGQISLMVGVHRHADVADHRRELRSDRRISRRSHRQPDDAVGRRAVRDSLHHFGYRAVGDV